MSDGSGAQWPFKYLMITDATTIGEKINWTSHSMFSVGTKDRRNTGEELLWPLSNVRLNIAKVDTKTKTKSAVNWRTRDFHVTGRS